MPPVRKTWLLVEEGDETLSDQEFQDRVRAEVEQKLQMEDVLIQEEGKEADQADQAEQLEALKRKMEEQIKAMKKEKQPAQYNDQQHAMSLLDITPAQLAEFPDRQISDFLIKRNQGMDIPPVLEKALKKLPGNIYQLVQVTCPPKAEVGDKCKFTRSGVTAVIFLKDVSGNLIFAIHDKRPNGCCAIS